MHAAKSVATQAAQGTLYAAQGTLGKVTKATAIAGNESLALV